MGHTAGLAKGFVIIAAIIVGVIAVVGGIAIGLASLFHSPIAFVVAGALATFGMCYLFYQPRSVCLVGGISGGLGGFAGYLTAAAITGILGTLASVVVGVIGTFVALVLFMMFMPKSGGKSESWRKSSKDRTSGTGSNDTNTNGK